MDYPEELFPYRFECTCGAVVTVSYRDAVDLAPMARTVAEAAEVALSLRHGWTELHRRKVCPSCADKLHGRDVENAT